MAPAWWNGMYRPDMVRCCDWRVNPTGRPHYPPPCHDRISPAPQRNTAFINEGPDNPVRPGHLAGPDPADAIAIPTRP